MSIRKIILITIRMKHTMRTDRISGRMQELPRMSRTITLSKERGIMQKRVSTIRRESFMALSVKSFLTQLPERKQHKSSQPHHETMSTQLGRKIAGPFPQSSSSLRMTALDHQYFPGWIINTVVGEIPTTSMEALLDSVTMISSRCYARQ